MHNVKGFLFLAEAALPDSEDGSFNVLKGGLLYSVPTTLPGRFVGAIVVHLRAEGPSEAVEHQVEIRVVGPEKQVVTIPNTAGKWSPTTPFEQINATRQVVFSVRSPGLHLLTLWVDNKLIADWSHIVMEPRVNSPLPQQS